MASRNTAHIDVSELFAQYNGQAKPRQVLSAHEIQTFAPEANDKLRAFIIDCRKTIPELVDGDSGPLKSPEVANKKAQRDYGGDVGFVCDWVRGKIVVDSPEQVMRLKQILESPDNSLMQKHGIQMVIGTDYFKDPKEPTGYRCLNYRLAVPVANEKPMIVELQVVAEQIENVYDQTHPYKRAIEDIFTAAGDRKLTKSEREEVSYNQAKLELMNGQAAMPYHYLVDPKHAEKYEMTEVRQRGLKKRIDAHESEPHFQ